METSGPRLVSGTYGESGGVEAWPAGGGCEVSARSHVARSPQRPKHAETSRSITLFNRGHRKKCHLDSNLNHARVFWLYAGNHGEPEGEIRNCAFFHARDSALLFF